MNIYENTPISSHFHVSQCFLRGQSQDHQNRTSHSPSLFSTLSLHHCKLNFNRFSFITKFTFVFWPLPQKRQWQTPHKNLQLQVSQLLVSCQTKLNTKKKSCNCFCGVCAGQIRLFLAKHMISPQSKFLFCNVAAATNPHPSFENPAMFSRETDSLLHDVSLCEIPSLRR